MKTQFNFENNQTEINNSQGRVKVTDLLSRLNEEKKIEKKRNLANKCCSCICSYCFRIKVLQYNFNNILTSF
jgi:hypothetical protein